MRRQAGPWLAAAVLLAAASASAGVVSDYDRFRLWNDCTPLRVAMLEHSEEARKIGLTDKALVTAVRSRLRAARLYSEKEVYPPLMLGVDVTVGEGGLFNISVELHKYFRDDLNDIDGRWLSVTWRSGSFGTHGGNASYVISVLSEHMDTFIDEYLRVNEDACE